MDDQRFDDLTSYHYRIQAIRRDATTVRAQARAIREQAHDEYVRARYLRVVTQRVILASRERPPLPPL